VIADSSALTASCVAAPGVPDSEYKWVSLNGLHCLEGTSDAIVGKQALSLSVQAVQYTEGYNASLLAQLRTPSAAATCAVPRAPVSKPSASPP
jgi:hypothetical protein